MLFLLSIFGPIIARAITPQVVKLFNNMVVKKFIESSEIDKLVESIRKLADNEWITENDSEICRSFSKEMMPIELFTLDERDFLIEMHKLGFSYLVSREIQKMARDAVMEWARNNKNIIKEFTREAIKKSGKKMLSVKDSVKFLKLSPSRDKNPSTFGDFKIKTRNHGRYITFESGNAILSNDMENFSSKFYIYENIEKLVFRHNLKGEPMELSMEYAELMESSFLGDDIMLNIRRHDIFDTVYIFSGDISLKKGEEDDYYIFSVAKKKGNVLDIKITRDMYGRISDLKEKMETINTNRVRNFMGNIKRKDNDDETE